MLFFCRNTNGPSDDSLNDSADMSNSTIQHNSSLPTQVYYGDESDEGLVRHISSLPHFSQQNL